MSSRQSLKVAIDACGIGLRGGSGGVGQALISLVHDLGTLNDGSEAYTVVVSSQEQAEWVKPYLGPGDRIVFKPMPPPAQKENLPKRLLKRIRKHLVVDIRQWPEVPISNGFYESLGCHVVHFLNQLDFVLCALPTVYNPHDLQHLHYPQFWTPSVIALRETIYPAACHFAQTVVVGSQWVKDDVIRQYRINSEKIQVIPEGPPTQSCPEPSETDVARVKDKYGLTQPFAIYPAVTWEHKNHLRLLEALAFLRDKQDLIVPLVCTGSQYAFWPHIERRVGELNLWPQVKFLGFVPDEDLRCLYRLSQFLILPTLFEASSLPIFEAWLDGVPVACSNVTALPDQVLDAALLFDPTDITSIANAVAEITANTKLRQELAARGYRRLQDFDCKRTARAYRAVYRRAAGFPLMDEDRSLLSWDWMRSPESATRDPFTDAQRPALRYAR